MVRAADGADVEVREERVPELNARGVAAEKEKAGLRSPLGHAIRSGREESPA